MTSSVDQRLLALFFLAWRGFAAEADRVLATAGLSRVHHRVLYTLARTPEVSVGELAAGLGISRQALHRSLSELSARGFISTRVSESNRRERVLGMTAEGRRIERRASSAQAELLAKTFARHGKSAAVGWTKIMATLAEPIAQASPDLLARKIASELTELAAAPRRRTRKTKAT